MFVTEEAVCVDTCTCDGTQFCLHLEDRSALVFTPAIDVFETDGVIAFNADGFDGKLRCSDMQGSLSLVPTPEG